MNFSFLKNLTNSTVSLVRKRTIGAIQADPNLENRMLFKPRWGIDLGAIATYPTGSRYTCNPPVESTDEDWIVLVEDLKKALKSFNSSDAREANWQNCSSYNSILNHKWIAWRKNPENYNLIVTDCVKEYIDFCAATALSKEMNILDKTERVKLFELVRSLEASSYYGPLPDKK